MFSAQTTLHVIGLGRCKTSKACLIEAYETLLHSCAPSLIILKTSLANAGFV